MAVKTSKCSHLPPLHFKGLKSLFAICDVAMGCHVVSDMNCLQIFQIIMHYRVNRKVVEVSKYASFS